MRIRIPYNDSIKKSLRSLQARVEISFKGKKTFLRGKKILEQKTFCA